MFQMIYNYWRLTLKKSEMWAYSNYIYFRNTTKIEIKFLDSETYKLKKEVLLRHVLGLHSAIPVYKLVWLVNTISQFHHGYKMMHGNVFNKRDLDTEITRF